MRPAEPVRALPLWRQAVLSAWLLAAVAFFLRQVVTAYAAMLGR